MSHSLDIAGSELTKALAHGMGIDFRRAEAYKRESGLSAGGLGAEKELRDILLTFVDKIVLELERMIDSYQRKTKRKVTKLILSGGSGGLVGLEEHLKKRLELNIEVANPWARVVRLSLLDPILKELAPRFAVAAGAAMREL
jgi:Tfp pilus assembly PilM family ATPase